MIQIKSLFLNIPDCICKIVHDIALLVKQYNSLEIGLFVRVF